MASFLTPDRIKLRRCPWRWILGSSTKGFIRVYRKESLPSHNRGRSAEGTWLPVGVKAPETSKKYAAPVIEEESKDDRPVLHRRAEGTADKDAAGKDDTKPRAKDAGTASTPPPATTPATGTAPAGGTPPAPTPSVSTPPASTTQEAAKGSAAETPITPPKADTG